ncbi:MAG: hypothetical protein PHN31_01020 [Candidatus Gracilibacteria bacterium]|nr:hypothetical protein [Candidatus Gracilibacteria bacterium]
MNNNFLKNKKKLIISAFVIGFIISGFYFKAMGDDSGESKFDKLSKEKADIIKKETDNYTKGIKKIDYNTTNSGIILNKYKEDKKLYFTGSNILVDGGKTLTGEFLFVDNVGITKDGGKYYYKKDLLPTGIIDTSESGTGEIKTYKMYELKFIKGFTKMKMIGEYYDYLEDNLKYSNTYTMNLFLSGDFAYVLNFENSQENKERREIYNEYMKKIQDIRKKHKGDVFMINKLTSELNKAYNIKANILR